MYFLGKKFIIRKCYREYFVHYVELYAKKRYNRRVTKRFIIEGGIKMTVEQKVIYDLRRKIAKKEEELNQLKEKLKVMMEKK